MRSFCPVALRRRSLRVVVVTGAGRGFCSGADVDRMAGQEHDLRGGRQRLQQGGHTFIRALHAIEKPTIAAVRGPAVGIGWSIALACDLVVASETARFSQIFRRIGLAPDGGAIWFLTRRLGMAKAKELVFTARFVEAQEALGLGLVNHVVADDQLMARPKNWRRIGDGADFCPRAGEKAVPRRGRAEPRRLSRHREPGAAATAPDRR